MCLINLSDKSDSCSCVCVDEWPSAAPSLYICQSPSRVSRVKRDKLDPKRRPFTFSRPPSGAPPLQPIQVLGRTLKCLLAYSIFTPPIEFSEPTSVLPSFFFPSSSLSSSLWAEWLTFLRDRSWWLFFFFIVHHRAFLTLIVCLLNDWSLTVIPTV